MADLTPVPFYNWEEAEVFGMSGTSCTEYLHLYAVIECLSSQVHSWPNSRKRRRKKGLLSKVPDRRVLLQVARYHSDRNEHESLHAKTSTMLLRILVSKFIEGKLVRPAEVHPTPQSTRRISHGSTRRSDATDKSHSCCHHKRTHYQQLDAESMLFKLQTKTTSIQPIITFYDLDKPQVTAISHHRQQKMKKERTEARTSITSKSINLRGQFNTTAELEQAAKQKRTIKPPLPVVQRKRRVSILPEVDDQEKAKGRLSRGGKEGKSISVKSTTQIAPLASMQGQTSKRRKGLNLQVANREE